MEKKQTAVQFLQQEIKKYSGGSFIVLGLTKEFEKALQMEREQIEEAFLNGTTEQYFDSGVKPSVYYAQTFKP
jgi:hypothetical protein